MINIIFEGLKKVHDMIKERTKSDLVKDRFNLKEIEITEKKEKLENQIGIYTKWTWVFVFLGFVIMIVSTVMFLISDTKEVFGWNLLGDFFAGGVSSFWSLAGLFLIYVAFLGQKLQLLNQQLELMYNREEMRITRGEIEGQKVALNKQNDTMELQKFENIFFQMLTLLNSLINSIDYKFTDRNYKGRAYFSFIYQIFLNRLQGNSRSFMEIDIRISTYNRVYNDHISYLSHYFRTLYHIIKLVDESEVNDKYKYTSIVRAQLSSREQTLLFYNCLHSNGKKKFKPLIEKYALFNNLEVSLYEIGLDIGLYEDGAYEYNKQ